MRAGWMAAGLALALLAPWSGAAQDFTGLARVDPASTVTDAGEGLAVVLRLSQPVPWRVFTLDDPRRLVVDLRTADWRAVDMGGLVAATAATGARAGQGPPGWSRLVIDLARPLAVAEAGMNVDAGDGTARLALRLDPVDAARFAAASRQPDPASAAPAPLAEAASGPLVVVIDPGHGGVDPGAERAGLREADITLAIGLALADAVARAGMVPVLTRADDSFVPLAARMTRARSAGADLLISIHADALEEDAASGASVYTLSDEGADGASERMVERHERGDLLAGLDLAGTDDTVATALLDLARQDTAPGSRRLADAIVAGLGVEGATVNSRPRREARLAVLNAADFPSVLIEVGFLSDEGDLARLTQAEGRAPIVAGIVAGIAAWSADDAAREEQRLR